MHPSISFSNICSSILPLQGETLYRCRSEFFLAQAETGDDNSGFQLVTLESALLQRVIELRGGTTLAIPGKSLFQT